MALTPDEEKLLDFANAALPSWFTSHARVQEFLGGAAKVMGAAQRQLEDWFTHVLIGTATGTAARDVVWIDEQNVLIEGNNLTKNAGGTAWNAGAISQRQVASGDCYCEFTTNENNTRKMCGLSNGDTDYNYTDIDFAIYPHSIGVVHVFEGGVDKGQVSPAYVAGDIFQVQCIAGIVTYWQNGELLYTSEGSPTYPLLIDCSLYSGFATLINVRLSGLSIEHQFDPDWLNQHARDRGTSRQEAETDVALRSRLRTIDDAVTRPALLSAAQAIIDAEGISGTVAMAELRRDKAFIGSFVSDTGTGGTFTGTAPDMKFEPDAPSWARPPFVQDFPPFGYQVVFSGAATAGNDGTFPVTGLDLDKAEYANASGVAEVDATVTWTAQKLDQDGNLADGFARAFIDRGYRIGHGKPNTIITILPYGSTPGTVTSVEEMLRQKKAAGIRSYVERRLTDPELVRPLWWGFPVPNEEAYLPGLPAIGNVVGLLNRTVLAPVGTPSHQQDFDVPAADSAQFDHLSDDGFIAGAAAVHDFDDVAFAILIVASSDAATNDRRIISKQGLGATSGFMLTQLVADTLYLRLRTGASQITLTTPGSILNDSTPFYCLLGISEIADRGYLETSVGNATPIAPPGSLTNSDLFVLGALASPNVWGGDIAAVLIWRGADAETVLANRAHLPDWWTWAKATAAWYT